MSPGRADDGGRVSDVSEEEAMGADTPNILSRETTFLMGILKKCFVTEKVSIKQNSQNPILLSEAETDPSTEGVSCHSVLPA